MSVGRERHVLRPAAQRERPRDRQLPEVHLQHTAAVPSRDIQELIERIHQKRIARRDDDVMGRRGQRERAEHTFGREIDLEQSIGVRGDE